MVMYIYLGMGLLILCLFFKKSKWICALFLIFLALTSASCSSVADYGNYYRTYMSHAIQKQNIEYVYTGLRLLAYDGGLSYPMFRLVLYAAGFGLFFSTIQRYTSNIGIVCIFYTVTFYWVDSAQTRSFVAYMIFIFSIRNLFEDEKISILKYYALVTVAALIHTSWVVAFVFPVVRYIGKYWHSDKKKRTYIMIATLVICLAAYTGVISMIGNTLLQTEKAEGWLTRRTRFGFLVPMTVQIFGYWILCIFYKESYKRTCFARNMSYLQINTGSRSLELEKGRAAGLYSIKKIYELSFLTMPLYIFHTEFYRLFRPFAILVSIAYAVVLEMNWQEKKGRDILLFILFVMAIFSMNLGPTFKEILVDSLIEPLVTDNIFINQDFSIFKSIN